MPKIIVSSRYLKKSGGVKAKNLVKYMATREGVSEYKAEDLYEPVTEEQEISLRRLLNQFPESKKLFEYDDYIKNPNSKNADELVSEILERYADEITSRASLVCYMAERPGVRKIGKHGLFSGNDGEVDLEQAMKDVSEHSGNIWSHVVSLKREDAERLQFNTPEKWRGLVLRNLETIADATKIKLDNMRFYAAFHDTAHHPHIHLLVFSNDPKEKGYLQAAGIEKIKSAFVNDIFRDELSHLYQEQTRVRDKLRQEAKTLMEKLLNEINKNEFIYQNLIPLIEKLRLELKNVGGKKVYGFLPKEIKATVDEILSGLLAHPVISEMYGKWCELEWEKYRNYSDRDVAIKPITEQQAFKAIKNLIIKAVLDLSDDMQNLSVGVSIRPRSVRADVSDVVNNFELNPDELNLIDEDLKLSKVNSSKVRTLAHIPVRSHSAENNYTHSVTSVAFSLIKVLGRMISDDYNRILSEHGFGVDHKLKRVIDMQREAMGVQIDRTMEQEY